MKEIKYLLVENNSLALKVKKYINFPGKFCNFKSCLITILYSPIEDQRGVFGYLFIDTLR